MPPLLLLKLVLTPLLVAGASLAARRWGPSIGGWIVSLPLTSGPILFFLALEAGTEFAADTAVGTLLGLGAICAFTLAYLVVSRRGPAASIVAASVGFAVAGLALSVVAGLPYPLLLLGVTCSIAGVTRALPQQHVGRSSTAPPAWDLPARVLVGTGLVVGLTAVAPLLGPLASGLVATFPVYVSVLTVFAHVRDGRLAGLGVLRGLLAGLYGTAAFFATLHVLLVPAGVGPAFAVAIAVTAIVSGLALRRLRAHAAAVHPGVEEPLPEPV